MGSLRMARRERGRARTWLLVAAVVFLAIQLVPYGWQRPNPPVTQDAPWPSGGARAIAGQSCYACHSNETRWPAYAYVAPMSWLVRRDVERGRHDLNFSTWDRDAGKADDAAESVLEGEMPPRRYWFAHPQARLTDEEARVLVEALLLMDRAAD